MKAILNEKQSRTGGTLKIECYPDKGAPFIGGSFRYYDGEQSIMPREFVRNQALQVMDNLLKFHNQQSEK